MNSGSPVRLAILRAAALAGAVAGLLLFLRFPDMDIPLLGIGAHRNFLFHSAVVPVMLAIGVAGSRRRKGSAGGESAPPGIPAAALDGLIFGCGIALGVHLAADAFQSHPVKFPIVGSLVDGTSLDDRLWLAGNALAGFAAAAWAARSAVRASRRGH